MKTYTDYDFYKNTYKGNMPESDFERIVIRASAEVRKNIFDRDITNYENEVAMATCSVVDILLKIEQIEKNISVKSESVGDYSRTFSSTTDEISNQKTKIKEELRNYLFSTGLLYRGV